MAVVGTTVTYFNEGRMPVAYIVTDTFTANGDVATIDLWKLATTKAFKAFTMRVVRTGTNACDIDLDGSHDGTNYTATGINNLTATSEEYHPATGAIDHDSLIAYRYVRILAVAVGANTTEVCHLWCY